MKPNTLAAMFVFLLAMPSIGGAQELKAAPDTIVVQAEGKYETNPDLAELTFLVSVQEKDLRRAYDKASAAIRQVLQVAERNGISKQDTLTENFTVDPVYDWSDKKRRVQAYRVDSKIVLRVRDFARIGILMDDSVQSGIAEFRSLTYALVDEENAKQRAIVHAMQSAKGRARAALGNNNRKLGPLQYVNVDVKQAIPIVQLNQARLAASAFVRREEMMEYAAPAAPLASPERIRMTATVQCVFKIE